MAAKVKALQQWCKVQCEGYRDVNITNMTSSWKSGLAFCAILHRFRPDLIDYESLSKENVYENNKLAFDTALEQLGIPALLDAEDMVAMAVPDKLCIVTYVSQYANFFRGKKQLGGPGVQGAKKTAVKRTNAAPDNISAPETKRSLLPNENHNPNSLSVPQTSSNLKRKGTYGDTCNICNGKVFLMERHIDNNLLYHRKCFRGQQRSSIESKRSSIASIDGTTHSTSASSNSFQATGSTNHVNGDGQSKNKKSQSSLQNGFDQTVQNKYPSIGASSTKSGIDHRHLPNASSSYLPSKFSYLSGGRTDTSTNRNVMNNTAQVQSKQISPRQQYSRNTNVIQGNVNKPFSSNIAEKSPGSKSMVLGTAIPRQYKSTAAISSVGMTSKSSNHSPQQSERTKWSTDSPASGGIKNGHVTSYKHFSPKFSSNEPKIVSPKISRPQNIPKMNEQSLSSGNNKCKSMNDSKVNGEQLEVPECSVDPESPGVEVSYNEADIVSGLIESLAKCREPGTRFTPERTPVKNDSSEVLKVKLRPTPKPAGYFSEDSPKLPEAKPKVCDDGDNINTNHNNDRGRSKSESLQSVSHQYPKSILKSRSRSNERQLLISHTVSIKEQLKDDAAAAEDDNEVKPILKSTNYARKSSLDSCLDEGKPKSILKKRGTSEERAKSTENLMSTTPPRSILKGKCSEGLDGQISPDHSLSTGYQSTNKTRSILKKSHEDISDSGPKSILKKTSAEFEQDHFISVQHKEPAKSILKKHGEDDSPPKPILKKPDLFNESDIIEPQTEFQKAVLRSLSRSLSPSGPKNSSLNERPFVAGGRENELGSISNQNGSKFASKPRNLTGSNLNSGSKRDVVKNNDDNKPEWVLEAERRTAARGGKYEDPEKTKVIHIKDSPDGSLINNSSEGDSLSLRSNDNPPKSRQDNRLRLVGQDERQLINSNVQHKAVISNMPTIPNRTLEKNSNDSGKSDWQVHAEKRRLEKRGAFSEDESSALSKPINIQSKHSRSYTSPISLVTSDISSKPSSSNNELNARDYGRSAPAGQPLHIHTDASGIGHIGQVWSVRKSLRSPPSARNRQNNSKNYQASPSSSKSVTPTSPVRNLLSSENVSIRSNHIQIVGDDDTLSSSSSSGLGTPTSPKQPSSNSPNSSDGTRRRIMPKDSFNFGHSLSPSPSLPNYWETIERQKMLQGNNNNVRVSESSEDTPSLPIRGYRNIGRPLPDLPSDETQRRKVNAEKKMSSEEILQSLHYIDIELQDLEKDGRVLEEKIRSGSDDAMDAGEGEEENLMIQWFDLVNEKNELVRREADLMYRQRQQELEEQHEDVEYELRLLMEIPDYKKTPSDKIREETLLKELLETVSQRNSIIDSIEEDRIKYLEEDQQIAEVLAMKGLTKDSAERNKKNKKRSKKEKKNKQKKSSSWFADTET